MVITSLSATTIHQLKSGQVITSVWSTVKELVENSLDAGATNIQIRLEDFGFSKIEVRDNGTGVPKSEVAAMVKSHCTSKLTRFEDVCRVASYGFRGEALASLCAVSDLRITTKTKGDLVSSSYSFDKEGGISGCEAQAGTEGTTVTAGNLFSNLPVRRNYYKALSRRKEELKKVERTVQAFAIINHHIRLTLHHNKVQIFGKIPAASILHSFTSVLSHSNKGNICHWTLSVDSSTQEVEECTEESSEHKDITVSLILPKKCPGMSVDLGRCTTDKTFIFVNSRPVELKEAEKLLRTLFSEAASLEVEKYPVSVLSIRVAGEERERFDPNLEPNKQKVSLASLSSLLAGLETFIRGQYGLRHPSWEPDMLQEEDLNDTYGQLLKQSEQVEEANNSFSPPADNQLKKQSCFTVVGPETVRNHPPRITDVLVKTNNLTTKYDDARNEMSDAENPNIGKGLDRERNRSGEGGGEYRTEESVGEYRTEESAGEYMTEKVVGENRTEEDGGEYRTKEGGEEYRTDEKNRAENDLKTKKEYSPVLKMHMFQEPNLPGRDALYISRLKDGDYPVEDAEDDCEDSEDNRDTKRMAKNPFIEYESELEGRGRRAEVEDQHNFGMALGDDDKDKDGENLFAQGRIVSETSGALIQPVQLLAPRDKGSHNLPRDSSLDLPRDLPRAVPSPASSRKRKLGEDDTTPRIDMFLDKLGKKSKTTCPSSPPATKLRPKLKTVDVTFSMKRWSDTVDRSRAEQEEVVEDALITTLDTPTGCGWLYTFDSCLHLLSPLRVKERLLYDRLLASQPLPAHRLDTPLTLYPGKLGMNELDTIRGLYTNTKQCPARITDRRMTFNGIDLVLYEFDRNITVKMEGINKDIKFYGLADLLEILELIAAAGPGVDSVAASRPDRVRKHLQEEAARLTRDQPPGPMGREEAAQLLGYKSANCVASCVHGRPASLLLHEFQEE